MSRRRRQSQHSRTVVPFGFATPTTQAGAITDDYWLRRPKFFTRAQQSVQSQAGQPVVACSRESLGHNTVESPISSGHDTELAEPVEFIFDQQHHPLAIDGYQITAVPRARSRRYGVQ